MPHERRRDGLANIRHMLGFSPLVGVIGHRQVGKTTLLSRLVKRYVTCDDATVVREAQADPANFLQQHAGRCVGIDECQLVPVLFPALKEWVRVHSRPGQFVLSGSVRFTSRRAIRESLTGRIVTQELLPFTIGELAQEPLADGLLRIMSLSTLVQLERQFVASKAVWHRRQREITLFLERGGLPGICMIRNPVIRRTKLAAQLQTLLDRDVRLVAPTTLPYHTIATVVAHLAASAGEAINLSAMRRALQVGPATLKKLLYALEAIFIIRTIPVEGSSVGQVYFFEDLAEWRHLLPNSPEHFWQMAHLIFHHARAQWIYQLRQVATFFQYRTRGGALVPVCVRENDRVLGLLPIAGSEPNRSEVATAASFLKMYGQGKLLYLSESAATIQGDTRTALVPTALVTC